MIHFLFCLLLCFLEDKASGMWLLSVHKSGGFLSHYHCSYHFNPYLRRLYLAVNNTESKQIRRKSDNAKICIFSSHLFSHIIGDLWELKKFCQRMCFHWVISKGPRISGQVLVASRTDVMASIEEGFIQSQNCFIAEKWNVALGTVVFVLLKESQKLLPVVCHLNSTLVLLTLPHLGNLQC